jgi:segregation and condensation protein B
MARVEAALLVADGALSTRKLAQFAMLADAAEARTLIDQLNVAYDQSRSAYRIERVATGYQMLTRPKFAPWLDKLHERQARLKLSAPAMETLAIVAYRQPITRADVEAVRGVASTEMLKQLMERGLVRITGEDDSLGRPYLYGTTRQFLELFGLRNTADLPLADQLRADKSAAEEDVPTQLSSASADSDNVRDSDALDPAA